MKEEEQTCPQPEGGSSPPWSDPRAPAREDGLGQLGHVTKVVLAFAVMLICLLLVGVMIDRSITSITPLLKQVTLIDVPISEAVDAMEENVRGSALGVEKYLGTSEPAHLQRVERDEADFRRFVSIYDQLVQTPSEKELGQRIRRLHDEYSTVCHTLIEEHDRQRLLLAQVTQGLSDLEDLPAGSPSDESGDADPTALASLAGGAEVGAEIARIGSWLGQYLRAAKSSYRERIFSHASHVRTRLGQLRKLDLPAPTQARIAEMETRFEQTMQQIEQSLALQSSLRANEQKLTEHRQEIDAVLDQIHPLARRRLAASKAEALATTQRLRRANVGTLGLGLIVCCAASFLVTRLSLQLQAASGALQSEAAERRRVEETRSRLWEKLVVTQEEERRHLSRELHDQMGQQLSALMLGLKSLAPDSSPRLQQLQELTGQLIRQMHSVAFELRPLALDDLGLHGGLTHYVEEWSLRSGVRVEFVCTPEGCRFPPPVETTIYRVVQEALTNVLKHARARSVSLIVDGGRDHARLVIEDDGCGFNPDDLSSASASQGLGLLGIRERVNLAGGRFEIESSPGAGAAILIRLPLVHPVVPVLS